MRIILYTGKGGTGKTSAAAASACKAASMGKRVLIMSTDQAHSLGDVFERKLAKEPLQISENLDAMEVDTVYESEKSWGNLKEYIKKMLTTHGEGGIEVEELLVFPGMEELFSLFKILDIYKKGEYDVLFVDCAPTGETLSLLKYPEMLSGFMDKILPMKRKAVKIAGPAIESITKIPMPEDSVFEDFEYILGKMEDLQSLLLDKKTVSIRIVTTPEKIVIKETRRNFTCLHLFNYNVDAIIVNRIYPKEAMEGYFNKWITMQDEGLLEIRESFSEVPRFYLELQKEEIRSLSVLKKIGEYLFEDCDPTEVLFCEEIFSVEKDETRVVLKILLPFANKEDLDLQQIKNELVLSVRNETRRFPLPLELKDMEIKTAKLEGEFLMVVF